MLFVVYFFEFYNAYTLYTLWTTSNCEVAWQVVALSAIFFIIACGNTVVVSLVVIRKLRESNDVHTLYEKLKSKYPSMQTIGTFRKWRLLENSCVFEGAYNGGEGLINFNTSRKKASRRPGGSER
ncbi:hypothetical protein Tcan_07383 [Toxocara canis]|uniref:Uncharacterized protein n=1 Tax=Toxocara canis TaxID=6265 RepID=A0A0B2W4A9_TOXCA|nr:hypothetical protein Tcan_07383 [Toxocara canis]